MSPWTTVSIGSKTAFSYEFDGLWGGVSIGYRRCLFIKSEYDAMRFNIGFGVELGKFLSANLVLIDGKKMAFGANLKRSLL